MTDLDLARRAVACPGWRWLPGCRVVWPDAAGPMPYGTVTGYESPQRGRLDVRWDAGLGDSRANPERLLPVLDNPATLGTLLALVREAWAPAWVELMREGDPADGDCAWGYVSVEGDDAAGARCFWSRADDGWAAALVAALECAPTAALEAAP